LPGVIAQKPYGMLCKKDGYDMIQAQGCKFCNNLCIVQMVIFMALVDGDSYDVLQ